MNIRLNTDEIRVLGCLIEKRLSTPGSYPLTLNSLVAACNQSSNRDPVVKYDQHMINDALINTRRQGYTTRLSSSGSRTAKFEEKICEILGLSAPKSSVLAELMLRGPQTPGELRNRCKRMHEFEALEDVDAVLTSLQEAELTQVLPKQPGKREARHAQLLGGPIDLLKISTSGHPSKEVVKDSEETLAERVATLEAQVAMLMEKMEELGEV